MLDDSVLPAITEHSPVHVTLIDTDYRIQFINKTSSSVEKADVLGKCLVDFLSAPQRDKLVSALEQVKANGESCYFESHEVNRDGKLKHWESRVGPIIKDDELGGYVIFSNDVTEQKKAHLERDAIFNLSSDMLCVVGFDGYFTSFNPAFCKTLGYSEEYLLNTRLIDLVHPDDREKSAVALGTTLTAGELPGTFENRYITSDDKVVTVQWSGTVDLEGRRIIGIGRDITETRALEQQLIQSQKMEAVGQLAGGVAHDFNNLLMAIMANAELAGMIDDLPDIRKRLKDIEAASARAAELTNKLLAFSRKQPADRKPLDLNKLIEKFHSLLTRVMPENIEVKCDLDEAIPKIVADRAQLEQALMMLCTNSRDAMPEGGTITLSTHSLAPRDLGGVQPLFEQVQLKVSDSGCGITPEQMDHIFEPFYTTKERMASTGLGLSTVYGIIKQHEGNVRAESTPAEGTTFIITLPGARGQSVPADPQRDVVGGSETILVAEDERLVSEAAVRMLKNAGYQVMSVSNGADAIAACHEQADIDLVFLDVVMPEMNGPEAAAKIRELKPEIPIIFASGYADRADAIDDSLQSVAVLNKPYKRDALLQNIRSLLDKPA